MADEELLRLAERCEAASGPDRSLDYLIGGLVGIHSVPEEQWAFTMAASAFDKSVPAYTASLDAAMTLVPEGAGFNLDRYWIREGVRWRVEIATGGIPEQPRQVFDCWDAHTAPLAIVAAALRARARSVQP